MAMVQRLPHQQTPICPSQTGLLVIPPCISSVPQGSVLGPLLFLIYINDLPQAVSHSTVYLFADDTKFFLDVSQSNTIDLQHDLNAVTEWCKTWKISLNLNKCSYMRYSSISSPPPITSPYVIEHISQSLNTSPSVT